MINWLKSFFTTKETVIVESKVVPVNRKIVALKVKNGSKVVLCKKNSNGKYSDSYYNTYVWAGNKKPKYTEVFTVKQNQHKNKVMILVDSNNTEYLLKYGHQTPLECV